MSQIFLLLANISHRSFHHRRARQISPMCFLVLDVPVALIFMEFEDKNPCCLPWRQTSASDDENDDDDADDDEIDDDKRLDGPIIDVTPPAPPSLSICRCCCCWWCSSTATLYEAYRTRRRQRKRERFSFEERFARMKTIDTSIGEELVFLWAVLSIKTSSTTLMIADGKMSSRKREICYSILGFLRSKWVR